MVFSNFIKFIVDSEESCTEGECNGKKDRKSFIGSQPRVLGTLFSLPARKKSFRQPPFSTGNETEIVSNRPMPHYVGIKYSLFYVGSLENLTGPSKEKKKSMVLI